MRTRSSLVAVIIVAAIIGVSAIVIPNYLPKPPTPELPPLKPPTPEIPALTTIDLSPHDIPAGITYDPSNGNAYVASSADHTISVIDGNSYKITDNINVTGRAYNFTFAGPIGLAFDPDNHSVYAAGAPYGMVSVVNVEAHNVTDTIDVGGNLSWIAINLQGKEVYVVDSSANSIYVISTKTQKVIDTIHTGQHPLGIAYNPDNGKLYAPLFLDNSVQVIDGKTHKIVDTIKVDEPGAPKFIAFDSNNWRAYVTCGNDQVVVIDTNSTKIIGKISMPTLPYGGYYDKTGQFVVYDNYSDVMRSNREKLMASPAEIVFNPDNGYMYVVNFGVGVLSVIDTKNMTIVDHIATPFSAYGIVYNQKNKIIYLSNEPLNSVSLIHRIQ